MENNLIMNKIGKKDLLEFTEMCASLFTIDKYAFIKEVELLYKWHNNGPTPEIIKSIQDKWYESLVNNAADYSVYNELFYLADCWACWKIYSRNYLRSLTTNKSLHKNSGPSIIDDISDIKTVVDVGCGIGYSTLLLKEIFKDSEVYGTNIINTTQWDLCTKLGVNLKQDVSEIKDIDLIVAFEYFEHFEDPVTHLKYLIETANPKYLIIANSFGTISIGHFNEQIYEGNKIPSKRFGRIFNNELKKLGYEKVKTNIFNNKPSYWRKIK